MCATEVCTYVRERERERGREGARERGSEGERERRRERVEEAGRKERPGGGKEHTLPLRDAAGECVCM